MYVRPLGFSALPTVTSAYAWGQAHPEWDRKKREHEGMIAKFSTGASTKGTEQLKLLKKTVQKCNKLDAKLLDYENDEF